MRLGKVVASVFINFLDKRLIASASARSPSLLAQLSQFPNPSSLKNVRREGHRFSLAQCQLNSFLTC